MNRLLILAALLASTTAYAQGFDLRDPFTGNGLLSICSLDEPVSRTACGLCIRGPERMLTTLQVHGQLRRMLARQFDVPPEAGRVHRLSEGQPSGSASWITNAVHAGD